MDFTFFCSCQFILLGEDVVLAVQAMQENTTVSQAEEMKRSTKTNKNSMAPQNPKLLAQ